MDDWRIQVETKRREDDAAVDRVMPSIFEEINKCINRFKWDTSCCEINVTADNHFNTKITIFNKSTMYVSIPSGQQYKIRERIVAHMKKYRAEIIYGSSYIKMDRRLLRIGSWIAIHAPDIDFRAENELMDILG